MIKYKHKKKGVIFLSQKEIEKAISNAESSLKMEGLSVDEKTKAMCRTLLTNEITMSDYLLFVKQKAGVKA